MAWYWQLLILIAIIAVVLFVVIWLIPFLRKKGILNDKVLTALGTMVEVVPLPDNIAKYKEIAEIAVNYAEQVSKTGKISPDQRKQAATELALELAEQAGFELNDKNKAIIDKVIEAAVQLLPKKE